jgi:hypothetical protein
MEINMNTKKTGFIIFLIGAVYMIMGSVAGWWVHTTYINLSPAQVSETVWASGSPFFILWSLSIPVGSILAAIGMVLYAQIRRSRMWSFVIGAILVSLWLYLWKTFNVQLYPPMFGVLGVLITLFFLAILWYWVKKRAMLEGPEKTAADFQLISYVFFVHAAWGICGLLDVPYFLFRPDMMLQFHPLENAHSMGALVIISLTLGWLFAFLSQYKARQATLK